MLAAVIVSIDPASVVFKVIVFRPNSAALPIEGDMVREGTRAGLKAAREQGRKGRDRTPAILRHCRAPDRSICSMIPHDSGIFRNGHALGKNLAELVSSPWSHFLIDNCVFL